MTYKDSKSRRRYVQAAAAAGICLAAAAPVHAQSTPFLQYSSVTGNGSTIYIVRLPIQVPGGGFVFKDVSVTLATTGNSGMLTATAAVKQATSLPIPTSKIVAGEYSQAENSGSRFVVSGPGPLADSDEAKWTLTQAAGYPCGAPAEFYTGMLEGNPLYSRLKAAGIDSTEYSYGIVDEGTACASTFAANSIIGVAQIGSQIEVDLFTNDGKDQSTPVERYLYNPVQ